MCDFRITPESGHSWPRYACPLNPSYGLDLIHPRYDTTLPLPFYDEAAN